MQSKQTLVTDRDLNGQSCQEQIAAAPTCKIPDTSVEDQHLVEKAVEICFPNTKDAYMQRYINASKLLSMESRMGIPDELRGMTLAAACVESGFNENAEGDHRFSKDGSPMAIGILQMWPLYEKAYAVNRRNVESSAHGWLFHIKRQLPSVKARCMTKTDRELWRLAWVHGVRGPKKGGRCNENVSHWAVFLKIRNELSIDDNT